MKTTHVTKYSTITQFKYHTVDQVIFEAKCKHKTIKKKHTNDISNTKDKLCNCRKKPCP